MVGLLAAEDRPVSQEVTEREHSRSREAKMSEKLPSGKTSRFLSHFIFADVKEESQALSDKLATILRGRFPNDSFTQVACPEALDGWIFEPTGPGDYMSLNPAACSKTLLIGIGTGGLAAYQAQQSQKYYGVSVFAACPPPGISSQPSGGPRVIIYGSKYGVYGIPLTLQFMRKKKDSIPTQLYALPSLIHGPKLALRCIAYLVGKYMNKEDLSQPIFDVTGDQYIHAMEGLE